MAKSIRWLGHASFILSTPGGKSVVIDPWIEGNPSCPVKLEEIEEAHLVLVTHDHFDHSGGAVDVARKTGATVIACPETANKFKEAGLPDIQIMRVNIGGSVTVEGITVTVTQAFHSSATGSCFGYIIKLEDGSIVYHAGDTGIFDSMKLLGELYPIDLALLPIGSVFTMDTYQAARALTLLKPKRVIPMHYKTFPVLEQTAEKFVALAREEAPQVEVVVIEPGQEYSW